MIDENYPYRKVVHGSFPVGEKYGYNIAWLFVDVGYATMEVKEILRVKKRDIYHIVFTAGTYPFFDAFFRIRDVAESYMDKSGVFPWRFTEQISEGKRSVSKETIYDQKKNMATFKEYTRNRTRTAAVLPYTQDFLSVVYYCRTFDIEKEKELYFNINNDGTAYEAMIKFIAREPLKVKAGRFNAIKVEVMWYKKGRKDRCKESHLLWLSADYKKIPLQVESEGEVGKFITSLVKIYK